MSGSRRIKPHPFRVYYVPVLLLALAGLLDSAYLSYSHYRVYTDISYSSFCAVSKAINCDTVSQSPYAIFLDIPVPVWGVIGYLFLVILVVFAGLDKSRDKSGWTLLTVICGAYSAYSIVLALISNYLIHSYCIMCIASYGINFALLVYCWLIRRRFSVDPFWKGLYGDALFFASLPKHQVVTGIFGLAVISTLVFLPEYWKMGYGTLNINLPHGMTEDGHPWIGAENPELTIVEFTDYLCFQCRKMHYYLRRLVEAHPDKIRLVHRHFPVDNKFNPLIKDKFHVGSGKLALLAIYAAQKGKFWEASDLLFQVPRENLPLPAVAEMTGLDARELAWALRSEWIRYLLLNDIREGLKLGVVGTPTYVINNEMYLGIIPQHVVSAIVD
ncbi:MAG: vitamin K epoxide reductase family protein [Thermodesulfobacteriota bacterium]